MLKLQASLKFTEAMGWSDAWEQNQLSKLVASSTLIPYCVADTLNSK